MGSRQQHLADDRRLFEGREYDDVHRILDQFAHYPDMEFLRRHRKFLHHREGIEYIRMRFGEEAGKSAEQHVQRDCDWIPDAADYYNGRAGMFGQRNPHRGESSDRRGHRSDVAADV